MMVMTAKVNLKKILLALAAAAAVILALIALLGGDPDTPTGSAALAGNDARVDYIRTMGWEVETTPAQSCQVKIPTEQTEVFQRYNTLQKSQGYDLGQYAGKNVMRYVYTVTNYPEATEPVYATLLVYKDQLVGADVTDTSARGKILPLQRQDIQSQSDPASQTAPTDAAAPTLS